MGIERMKYVNFVGGKEYLDDFINKYMTGDYALQPEYAMSVLKNVSGLYAYKESIPARSCSEEAKASWTRCTWKRKRRNRRRNTGFFPLKISPQSWPSLRNTARSSGGSARKSKIISGSAATLPVSFPK